MNDQQTEPQNSDKHRPPADFETVTKIADLQRMNIDQLQSYARNIGLKHTASLPKSGVVFEIVKTISERPNEVLFGEGVLEVLPDGFGFLRSPYYNYLPSTEDCRQLLGFEMAQLNTIWSPSLKYLRQPIFRQQVQLGTCQCHQ